MYASMRGIAARLQSTFGVLYQYPTSNISFQELPNTKLWSLFYGFCVIPHFSLSVNSGVVEQLKVRYCVTA